MLIRYMTGSKTTTIFCAFFIMSVNVRERELAKLDGIDEQQNVEMLKPEWMRAKDEGTLIPGDATPTCDHILSTMENGWWEGE